MPDDKKSKSAVPPIDFPLMPSDKAYHAKMDPKLAKPKKKLTPELLDVIARVQGTQRKIYKSKEEKEVELLKSLQKEIVEICSSLKKTGLSDTEKQEIKNKLAGIISKMLQFDSKYSKKYSDFK
jgi:hypothetical protein